MTDSNVDLKPSVANARERSAAPIASRRSTVAVIGRKPHNAENGANATRISGFAAGSR